MQCETPTTRNTLSTILCERFYGFCASPARSPRSSREIRENPKQTRKEDEIFVWPGLVFFFTIIPSSSLVLTPFNSGFFTRTQLRRHRMSIFNSFPPYPRLLSSFLSYSSSLFVSFPSTVNIPIIIHCFHIPLSHMYDAHSLYHPFSFYTHASHLLHTRMPLCSHIMHEIVLYPSFPPT